MGHRCRSPRCRARQHRYRYPARCLSPRGDCRRGVAAAPGRDSGAPTGDRPGAAGAHDRKGDARRAVCVGVSREPGETAGVATGNLEQIGWLKIEIAGLRDWFSFGGFSDRHVLRSDMIANALAAARKIGGEHVKVCVVGDTPSDIAAAKANGLPTIAVATGVYPYQTLLEHQPEVCDDYAAGAAVNSYGKPARLQPCLRVSRRGLCLGPPAGRVPILACFSSQLWESIDA